MASTPKAKGSTLLVPLPAVCAELPDELRVKLPGGTGLTTDPTSPRFLAPSTSSQHRLWGADNPSHMMIVPTAFGLSQARTASRKRTDEELAVDADWNISGVPRYLPTRSFGAMPSTAKGNAESRAPAPVDAVGWLVPEDCRAEFIAEGQRFYGSGKVPGGVLDALDRERTYMHSADKTPQEFTKYGWGNALERDGMALGRRQRRKCGAMSMGRRTLEPSGTEQHDLWQVLCQSQRCPRCATVSTTRWKARVQAQVDRDLAAGRDYFVLLTLTLGRGGYQNGACACKLVLDGKRGPWRRFITRLRRLYPDLAFLRVVEFHRDGWPHLHVLVRCRALVDDMLAEAGLGDVEALRTRVLEVQAENSRRKKSGEVGRLRSPYAKVCAGMKKMAVKSGWGTKAFDFDLVRNLAGIGAELAKTKQCNPDMPRGVRRFQASGSAGGGKDGSFFHNEWKKPSVEATIPRVDHASQSPPRGGVVGYVDVKEPVGAPKLRIGADVTPGAGHLRVRIESVTTDDLYRCGERLVLGLRILEPEPLAHGRLHCTIPFAYGADLEALLRNVLGLINLNQQRHFEPEWLLGQEGWVYYEPRGTLDATTGEPLRWPRFDWGRGPEQATGLSAKIESLVPVWAMDDAAQPTKGDGVVIERVLHLAPLDAVVEAMAKDRADMRFCGARVEAAWDEAEGTLVRHLVGCQEALLERYGIEALADYLDLLVALQALGPPEVLEINDLKAIAAGVKATMAKLSAQKADTA